ncbi:efflux RND transporter periplasmic adaptor subunit [Novosphingobium sp. M1R2S20]|uniref:Efflux RND transporter periplasmic adaptor subunit n=1 Tax=Novosphingobium rhizovicinum TaxID=3228928 RepID=A0ABV3RFY1_9SPHN
MPNLIELPGRIEAVRTAEVRARTDGIVLSRHYEEGAFVAAGTPLFSIDPRDYRAQVQSAEAALQRAVAARENASSIVIRYGPLIDERAVSAQEYDAAQSDLRQASAQVAEARAALERARLQLSYTTVRAPIAGRAGAAEVTEGALVSGAEGTLMTRVDQVSPVYAVFSASNAAVLNTISDIRQGKLKVPALDAVEAKLVLENGEVYGPIGHLDFASPVVSPETGSQIIRANFINPDGLLSPGQFVRGRIEMGMRQGGVVIPARAVQMKGDQPVVSVVGTDGTVTARNVELGAMLGSRWVISSGLKPGERIIANGWQKVQPGQKVTQAPARPATRQTAAAAGQGG